MQRVRLSGGEPSDEPTEPQLEAWRRRSRPDNEVPHPLGVGGLLARTADVALAISGVAAYGNGISFEIAIRLRTTRPGLRSHRLHELLAGGWRDEDQRSKQLLLGVEYADGRRATSVASSWPLDHDEDPDVPVLTSGNSGGSELAYDMSYWLTPVPPDGPVTFVCVWPALEVAESTLVVPDAAFTSASAHAVQLWPQQPAQPFEPPPPPELPASGWFAETAADPADG